MDPDGNLNFPIGLTLQIYGYLKIRGILLLLRHIKYRTCGDIIDICLKLRMLAIDCAKPNSNWSSTFDAVSVSKFVVFVFNECSAQFPRKLQ